MLDAVETLVLASIVRRASLGSNIPLSVLSAPNLLLLVLWWLLPESPRWLIAKNKKAQLSSVLEQAARVNNKAGKFDHITESGVNEDTVSSTDSIASATLVDLFWPPTILIRSCTMFFNWTVTTMCYYGLTSAAATLTPDLYLNFSLAILVEVSPTTLQHHFYLTSIDRIGPVECRQF